MSQEVLHVNGFYGHLSALNGQYFCNLRSDGTKPENHGRPIYTKITTNSTNGPNGQNQNQMQIYYWNESDGPELMGWWCAPAVGSEDVWSRNISKSMTPPKIGWLVPWNAKNPNNSISMELETRRGPLDSLMSSQNLNLKRGRGSSDNFQNLNDDPDSSDQSLSAKCQRLLKESGVLNSSVTGANSNDSSSSSFENNLNPFADLPMRTELESVLSTMETNVKQLSIKLNRTAAAQASANSHFNYNKNDLSLSKPVSEDEYYKEQIEFARQMIVYIIGSSAKSLSIPTVANESSSEKNLASATAIVTSSGLWDSVKEWTSRLESIEQQMKEQEQKRIELHKKRILDLLKVSDSDQSSESNLRSSSDDDSSTLNTSSNLNFVKQCQVLAKNISTALNRVTNDVLVSEKQRKLFSDASNLRITNDKDTAITINSTLTSMKSHIHRISATFNELRKFLSTCRELLDKSLVDKACAESFSNDEKKMIEEKLKPAITNAAHVMMKNQADFNEFKRKLVVAKGECTRILALHRQDEA